MRELSTEGGSDQDKCPFDFNFDPATFKVGDWVSYRVPSVDPNFPFAGQLLEVGEDYVVVSSNPNDPTESYRASRESRPVVAADQI
jgi:hypothetical protein